MKHSLRDTFEMLAWFALSIVAGIIVIPRIAAGHTVAELAIMPAWAIITFILVGVGIGTAFWLYALKRWKKQSIAAVFALGIGSMTLRTVTAFFPRYESSVTASLAVFIGAAAIYWIVVWMMQKSWNLVRYLYWIQNLFMTIALPTIAAIVGYLLPLWASFLLLAIMALYDAVAVWKTKHMIELATQFVDMRVIPGISVPKRTEKEGFAILGGGDVFFIVLVGASIWKYNPVVAVWDMYVMALSIVVLFAMSKKGKFYPALPFIFAGAVIGIVSAVMFI